MPADGIKKLKHEQILSVERIEEIVSTFAELGISKVRITGGEPLVRNGICEIIKRIKDIPGVKEIALTTNGIKLVSLAESLKKSGLDRINVSLDTLDNDKYHELTRVGHLSQVLEGIKKAKEVGFENIKINTVLIGEFNDNEIDDFIDFAADNHLTVRFIELMPIGESVKMGNKSFIANGIISKNPRLTFVKNDGVSSLYRINNSDGLIGLISPLSNKFCQSCNRIRLTADGKIKPCLHSSQEIDINSLNKEELKAAIENAIKHKPKEHHLESGNSESMRAMNKIGG